MLPMRIKLTYVHCHMHKKICQTKVIVKHLYKVTRSKANRIPDLHHTSVDVNLIANFIELPDAHDVGCQF
jgi:hypothetical protein